MKSKDWSVADGDGEDHYSEMIPSQKIVQPSVINQVSQGPLHYVAHGDGTPCSGQRTCARTDQ